MYVQKKTRSPRVFDWLDEKFTIRRIDEIHWKKVIVCTYVVQLLSASGAEADSRW